MADSRKVEVSKVKIGEYVDPRPMSERDAKPWDQVEVVEVWYHPEARQGRGYYLHVGIWRERKEQEGDYTITSVMIGTGSSTVRELLELSQRFSQKTMASWVYAVRQGLLQKVDLEAMRARVREMQGVAIEA